MEAINGTWKVEKDDDGKVAEFLKKIGLPEEMIKKLVGREYVLVYKVNGTKVACEVKVTNDASLGVKTYEMELNEEVECISIDDDKTKCLVKFEEGKFVEKYVDYQGMTYDVTREIDGDVMMVTTAVKDESNTQKWTRC